MFRFIVHVAAALIATQAFAQFGQKPAKIIFPFAAGGSGDAIARLVAEKLQQATGQPVLVENRTGASGRIGVVAVKQSEPDGTTILMTPFTLMLLYPHIYPQLSYDPEADFAPVSQIASFEFALTVHKDVPVKTVAEFVEWVKANPAKASYGTPGPGTLPHFLGDAFSRAGNLGLVHVAYRGASAALNDLVAGQIAVGVLPTADILEQHKAGNVRVLANFDAKRSPYLPELPTIRESGYPLSGNGWFAFYVPAKTPAPIVERISALVREALNTPEVKDRIFRTGSIPTGTTPAELAATGKADGDFWVPIVKASGFKPDD
jgi:tripartite-type tricarboxylate transporter receptor subunit TctC